MTRYQIIHVCTVCTKFQQITSNSIFHNHIVSPNLHHPLGHGWTSFVAQELRADSLIVLLTLSELKIAAIQKILPWSALEALQVRIDEYE